MSAPMVTVAGRPYTLSHDGEHIVLTNSRGQFSGIVFEPSTRARAAGCNPILMGHPFLRLGAGDSQRAARQALEAMQ